MGTSTRHTERVTAARRIDTSDRPPPVAPGLRTTRQRTAVVEALATLDDFRSANQLHDLLRERGQSVGLSTVYRTLQALAEAGEIDAMARDDGETAYRRCSDHHHHHLVCRSCGQTVEVMAPSLERWSHAIAEQHGYSEITHTLEIQGRCGTCAANDRR